MWSSPLLYQSLFRLEGNPFIIRFKTQILTPLIVSYQGCLEGNPFIIRFKTITAEAPASKLSSLEGNPFIIRFKT